MSDISEAYDDFCSGFCDEDGDFDVHSFEQFLYSQSEEAREKELQKEHAEYVAKVTSKPPMKIEIIHDEVRHIWIKTTYYRNLEGYTNPYYVEHETWTDEKQEKQDKLDKIRREAIPINIEVAYDEEGYEWIETIYYKELNPFTNKPYVEERCWGGIPF